MPVRTRFIPVIAGLAALLVTVVVAWFVHVDQQDQRRERLSAAANRIEKRVAKKVLALQAIRGAFVGARQVPTRQFFADMVSAMPDNGDAGDAQAFGFAIASATSGSSLPTERVAADYGMRRAPWPATDQPIRFPIVMLEPQDERQARALNFDMYSEPVRREAMQSAERTGRPAMTRPVRLQQDLGDDNFPGFLIYVPLYARDGVMGATPRQPDEATGFVYAPVRSSELIERVLSEEPPLNMGVEVYSDAVRPENLLHRGNAALRNTMHFPIRVADRTWVVAVGEYAAGWRGPSPVLFVSLIGLMMSGALAALLREHFRTVEATERLAEETRKRADQQQVLLGESQHRIKNSIARKLALFRMTVRETKDRDELIRTFETRMQSMARAQELLLTHPGGGLPIARLLEQELGQWQNASGVHWGGPDIRLEGSQLQALGLIIHEMTTNSLKYGALATGKALDVSWTEREEAGKPLVDFVWREAAGAGAQASSAAGGFGSRLIRLMVEGQLGGTERRSHENGELTLTIRFPLAPTEEQAMP